MILAAALLSVLSAGPEVHRFALVVGSNVGDGVSAAPLRFADDDALSMHELLQEAGVESVLLAAPDDDTRRLHKKTVPDAPPTLDALRGAFAAQRASMEAAHARGETVEWLFFFSGHGEVDGGEGFLGLQSGRLTRSMLHDELIARAGAEHTHVLIDACRSGALVGGKGPGGRRLPMPLAFAAEPEWPVSAGFVLSASSARESHEWEKVQSGVFSYEVRSALRGAADADHDGAVSYAELGAFLRNANRGIDNPALRPDFVVLPPQGASGLPVPLLSWGGRVPVDADVAVGHAYVERANGERLLDFNAAAGFVARLFLPVERPLFVHTADGASEVEITEEAPKLSALEVKASAMQPKGALSNAFEQLFAQPFSEQTVSEYEQGWKPPDLSTLEVHEDLRWRRARLISGGLAIGTALISAGGFIAGWAYSSGASGLSGAAREDRNHAIVTANGFGVGGAVAFGVAAMTWVIAGVFEEDRAAIALLPTPGGAALAFSVAW